MRAYDKRKFVRRFWAKQMKSGLVNNASTGNWDGKAVAPQTTVYHNQLGASHSR